MADKLRTGVIGCGLIAANHVRAYLKTGRFEVVALADLWPQAMNKYDEEFGLTTKHYADARDMLDREGLDVVSVGVWHRGHATWTIAAAARRPKAILCEKPMAETLQRAEQMMVACRRNGVKLAIAHQRRFCPAYTLARDLIAQGAVGDVQMMQAFGADGLPNDCSHLADMFRYLLGDDECEWVMGNIERKTDRYERATRIEDRGMGLFQFRGGARAMIMCEITPLKYQGALISGTEGMIDLKTDGLRLLNESTGGAWKLMRPDGRFFKSGERELDYLEAGAAQADELADWVEGKVETHRGAAVNGYKALEMIHAIYESARCHERVTLPLQTRLNPLDLMVESGHLTPARPGAHDIRAFLLHEERLWSDDLDRETEGQ